MKQVFIEQNSPEWHELRRTKIGASVSAALLGKNPYITDVDVYMQMVQGKVPFVNEAMKRGSELEPIARDHYNRLSLSAYLPAVCINDKYPYMMASLDGYEAECNMILEIKCPGDKVYQECTHTIPKHWEYQIQHQLLVSDAEFAHLLVWKNKNEFKCHTYHRDEKMMEEVRAACQKFHTNHILEYKPPETKYEDRFDRAWIEASLAWRLTKSVLKNAEEAEREAHHNLIILCEGRPTEGAGVRVEKNEVKGQIDYKQIDVLKNIDLEQFRKPTTIRWRICETDVK